MPTTTAITMCFTEQSYQAGLAFSTTTCTTTQPAILGTFTYGEILTSFFLFIIMLGFTFGFIIKYFVKKVRK